MIQRNQYDEFFTSDNLKIKIEAGNLQCGYFEKYNIINLNGLQNKMSINKLKSKKNAITKYELSDLRNKNKSIQFSK